jgi:hypothetical protein
VAFELCGLTLTGAEPHNQGPKTFPGSSEFVCGGQPLFQKFVNALKKSEPLTLKIQSEAPPPRSSAAGQPDSWMDHRFVEFIDPRTNQIFIGHPVRFMPGMRHQSIEPWAHNVQGVLGLWANDMEHGEKAAWSDDPKEGIFTRVVLHPRELLGRKGSIEGVPYVFANILQVARNTVVYHLANCNTQAYIVMGLGRDELDPVYGLTNYIQKMAEGRRSDSAVEAIAVCDKVLAKLPDNEYALFNKGVFLLADNRAEEAHDYFERVLQVNPNDVLALINDAAALARMQQDELAIERLAQSDSLSEESCRSILGSLSSLKTPLDTLMSGPSAASETAQHLRQKYFAPQSAG